MQASGEGLAVEADACEVVLVVIVVSRSGHATAQIQMTSTRLCIMQFCEAKQPKATVVRVAKDDYDGEGRRLGDDQGLGMKPGMFFRIRRHPGMCLPARANGINKNCLAVCHDTPKWWERHVALLR